MWDVVPMTWKGCVMAALVLRNRYSFLSIRPFSEDLIIALKNPWLKYADQKGDNLCRATAMGLMFYNRKENLRCPVATVIES